MDTEKYIIDRINLYNDIKHSKHRFQFMGYLDDLKSNKLNSAEIAIKKMYEFPKLEEVVNRLRTKNIPVLINGSIPLQAVWRDADFKPNDVDLYVMRVDRDTLKNIEQCFVKVFKGYTMVVIRNVITMTWIFNKIHEHGEDNIKIQVNLLYIEKSWSEIMVSYHSDLTAIGFDILESEFVYLKGRFDKTLTTNTHYFTDIINLDTKRSLSKAVKKYRNRGFNAEPIFIEEHNSIPYYSFSSDDNDDSEYVDLLGYIWTSYQGVENICFATSCNELLPDTHLPRALDIKNIKDGKYEEFSNMPSNISQTIGFVDSMTGNKETIMVECRNCANKYPMTWYLLSDGYSQCGECSSPIYNMQMIFDDTYTLVEIEI